MNISFLFFYYYIMIKNIVATVWEYTAKDGTQKKQYVTIGKLIEKDGKQSIKIDTIPTWWNWWAWVYDQTKKDSTHVEATDTMPAHQELPF